MSRNRGSYAAGEWGVNRVRATERAGRWWLEWRQDRRKVRRCLGRVSAEVAKREAEELAARLRRPERHSAVTLATLFDNYLREVTPTKSRSTQQHDRAALGRFLRIFGPVREAASLTHRDAVRYEQERRRGGDLRPRRKPKPGEPAPDRAPIRQRIIASDLRTLRAVLNWAKHGGWLERNPLDGYQVEEERNPHRPMFTEAEYEQLLAVAPLFPWQFRVLLILAHETGHRIGAICALRWKDVDLSGARVVWRAASDKIGWEHITPLSPASVSLLEDVRRRVPAIGETPVVPGVSRHLARDWMQRAQCRAGFAPVKGRGYHALRRHFASELRHLPLRDLCNLGGWREPMTVVKCYQQAEEVELRAALESRRALRA